MTTIDAFKGTLFFAIHVQFGKNHEMFEKINQSISILGGTLDYLKGEVEKIDEMCLVFQIINYRKKIKLIKEKRNCIKQIQQFLELLKFVEDNNVLLNTILGANIPLFEIKVDIGKEGDEKS